MMMLLLVGKISSGRSMLAHFGNPLVIKRSNYFCSTLMFWTRRLDEMLSDDDMRTLFSSTQSVPVRLSSCCRDRSVCLSSSNFLLCSHLLMVPMASQPLMASLAYVQDTHRQGCISCGILVSGIRARGVSSEHMENMEMFSCSPT